MLRADIILALIFLSFSSIYARIIHVPSEIDSIQGGINIANDGDTVLVDVGTYYENINFNGKNIVLGSLFITIGDTSYISQTIIDGNQRGSVIVFENGEDSTACLSGFTVRHGNSEKGGGIYCFKSSPKLKNSNIENNYSLGSSDLYNGGSGGGVYCERSSPSMNNIVIVMSVRFKI